MERQRIAPQSGIAFELSCGDYLRVTDPSGEQVADLMAFASPDTREWLSSGRTLDYAGTIYPTVGHILYSNRSIPMLTITGDSVGRHDFLYTPCSPETFSIIYGSKGHHPSCLENLATSLAPFGIHMDQIPTTFNIFMNVELSPMGELKVVTPLSKAGDFIEMRAEMDLVIGLTACSAEMSNNYSFKPIDVEISRPDAPSYTRDDE